VSYTSCRPGVPPQLGQVTLAGAVEIGLGVCRWIDGDSDAPEVGDRRTPAGVVPHAGRDHTARSDHATHLAHPRHRVSQKVHDELGHGDVKATVIERQLLTGARIAWTWMVGRAAGI
jgi:hypothetical protein